MVAFSVLHLCFHLLTQFSQMLNRAKFFLRKEIKHLVTVVKGVQLFIFEL